MTTLVPVRKEWSAARVLDSNQQSLVRQERLRPKPAVYAYSTNVRDARMTHYYAAV